MRYIFTTVLVCLFIYGCTLTKQAVNDYQSCMGDPKCEAEVNSARNVAYVVTKKTIESSPVPNIAEWLALGVSSGVGFLAGVLKGRKKRQ